MYPREKLAHLHRMTSMNVYNDNAPNVKNWKTLQKFIINPFLPKTLINTSAVLINIILSRTVLKRKRIVKS